MNEPIPTRIRKLTLGLIGLLAAGGILYALWAIGHPVPCLFRWLTGLRCPSLNKRDERIALTLVVVLLAWGVFRNLFGY